MRPEIEKVKAFLLFFLSQSLLPFRSLRLESDKEATTCSTTHSKALYSILFSFCTFPSLLFRILRLSPHPRWGFLTVPSVLSSSVQVSDLPLVVELNDPADLSSLLPVVACFLSGVTTVQAFYYMENFPKDRALYKYLVLGLFVLDMTHTAICM